MPTSSIYSPNDPDRQTTIAEKALWLYMCETGVPLSPALDEVLIISCSVCSHNVQSVGQDPEIRRHSDQTQSFIAEIVTKVIDTDPTCITLQNMLNTVQTFISDWNKVQEQIGKPLLQKLWLRRRVSSQQYPML